MISLRDYSTLIKQQASQTQNSLQIEASGNAAIDGAHSASSEVQPTAPIDDIFVVDLTTSATDVIVRFGGADSLLHIIQFKAEASVERALGILLGFPRNVTEIYIYEVLENAEPLFGTAYSPSLLGAFYLIFPHVVFVCLALVAFLIFWRIVFMVVANSKLKAKAAALPQLTILFALYVSEGTLETLPLKLLTFAAMLAGVEIVIRIVQMRLPTFPLQKGESKN